ncbi:MAG: GrpB family protein [Rubripirellula sp.]
MHESQVRLMHYDPRWRQEFEQTRSSILHSCVGWVTAVEHVGSTAISGLIARPTVDVVAAVADTASMEAATDLIEGLNFRRDPNPDWTVDAVVLTKPRHLSVAQPDPTHQVWLVLAASPLWHRLTRMRDWLRANAETAIRFEEAKVASWRSSEGDFAAYQSDKALFFAHLEDQMDAGRTGE